MPPTPAELIQRPDVQAEIAAAVAAMFREPSDWTQRAWARNDRGEALDIFSIDDPPGPGTGDPACWSLGGGIRMQCAEKLGIALWDSGAFADRVCEIYCGELRLPHAGGPEGWLNAIIDWDDAPGRRFEEVSGLADRVATLTSRHSRRAGRGSGEPGWLAFGSVSRDALRDWLSRGGSPLSRDIMGATPLHLAADGGNVPAMELLLEAGADIHARNRGGMTPLLFASQARSPAALRLLLDAGADAAAVTETGCGALHLAAAWRADLECARILAEAGADAAAREKGGGETPLHLAATYDRVDIVEFLLEAGASCNAADRYGTTPLHHAANNANPEVARALVAAGADPNAAGAQQVTPLHLAASAGTTEHVRVLLEAGADPGARNEFGDTPADMARHEGREEAAGLLAEAVGRGLPEPAA